MEIDFIIAGGSERAVVGPDMERASAIHRVHIINHAVVAVDKSCIQRVVCIPFTAAPEIEVFPGYPQAVGAKSAAGHRFLPNGSGIREPVLLQETLRRTIRRML